MIQKSMQQTTPVVLKKKSSQVTNAYYQTFVQGVLLIFK